MGIKSRETGTPSNGWILPLVIGGITGGLSSFVLLSWMGNLVPNGVDYMDLAVVLLTAVGVLVTVLGVTFAIAAFWGFSELKKSSIQAAIAAAESASVAEVKEQIENGDIRNYLERAISEEINSDGMEERIKARVDEVTFGNPKKDEQLEEDEVEGEVEPGGAAEDENGGG